MAVLNHPDHAHGDAKDDNRDDADDDGHTLQHSAEAAKQRGNMLYQQGQFQQAISLYSVSTFMLLLLQKQSVLCCIKPILCEYVHATQ